MQNSETYSIANLHRVTTVVMLTHGKAIKIARDVVRGAGITVPISIHLVRV
jgi:hypothetical protein